VTINFDISKDQALPLPAAIQLDSEYPPHREFLMAILHWAKLTRLLIRAVSAWEILVERFTWRGVLGHCPELTIACDSLKDIEPLKLRYLKPLPPLVPPLVGLREDVGLLRGALLESSMLPPLPSHQVHAAFTIGEFTSLH
jgi:hypothetical protein